MSDKPGKSTHSGRSAAREEELDSGARRRRETYERLRAEMSGPSTSGMASSTQKSRKRPRRMKADEEGIYLTEKDKIDSAIGDVAARVDDATVPKNLQENPEQMDQGMSLSASFTAELNIDLELPEKTSTPVQSSSGGVKRKRSFLLQGQFDESSLELNDDAHERRLSVPKRDKKTPDDESEQDKDDPDRTRMEQIAQMSTEELADRVFNCMRLCAENKINVRNAFSLHLIDWLPHLLKHKNPLTENFSTLACTLDASAKIYSHRVDIVHKEVLKLAEMLAPPGKGKRGGKEDKDQKSKDGQAPEKKKKMTVVANPAVLLRKRAGKNPLRKFVKVGAHPGDLMEAMLKTSKTFSTETPFKPVGKVSSRGKLVPLKIKSRVRRSRLDRCSLSRISDQVLGTTRRGKKRGASSMAGYDEDSDRETAYDNSDPYVAGLVADFESCSPEVQKDVLERVVQKVEESKLLDNPEQFTQLSRVEQLGLVLTSEPDSFVNRDLEQLLYGPLHLRRLVRVGGKKPKRGRKKKVVQYVDFKVDPATLQEPPVETKPKRKTGKQKSKARKRVVRTQLTLRTINNWNEYKSLGPEEIVINKNFLNELKLRDDFNMKDQSLLEPDETQEGDDDNWEDMDVEVTIGHDLEVVEDRGRSVKALVAEEENNELEGNKENQEFEMGEDKENQDYEMGDDVASGFTNVASMEDLSTVGENQEGPAAETTSSAVKDKDDESDSDSSSMCSLVEAPVIVKVQELKYSTTSSRVNMKRLKGTIKNILDEGPLGNKENAGEGTSSQVPDEMEGAVALPPPSELQPVMFADVYQQLPDRLDPNSAEDLTPQMAFLALLHVASENQLLLQNDETSDVVISKMKDEPESQTGDQQ